MLDTHCIINIFQSIKSCTTTEKAFKLEWNIRRNNIFPNFVKSTIYATPIIVVVYVGWREMSHISCCGMQKALGCQSSLLSGVARYSRRSTVLFFLFVTGNAHISLNTGTDYDFIIIIMMMMIMKRRRRRRRIIIIIVIIYSNPKRLFRGTMVKPENRSLTGTFIQ